MPLLEEYRLTDKVAVLAGEGNEFTPYLAEVLAEAGASVYVMGGAARAHEGGGGEGREAGRSGLR